MRIGSGEGSTIVVYLSPNIFRVIKSRRRRCIGHLARIEAGRSDFKILKAEPTGKIPLGRHRRT